ncbi:hypothetical protein AK812_SmicGene37121 [Symbiodinium microadriaticum]|uniref:WW domain-containing protein n=1 Tax=Symbiodinium microadriaticum TaxID=2951 RepID=A0A1Q9CH18_SYMMI|nr:hypothetical protein AK812_SmicGene37121 [Symbiodinium microadriaticum]
MEPGAYARSTFRRCAAGRTNSMSVNAALRRLRASASLTEVVGLLRPGRLLQLRLGCIMILSRRLGWARALAPSCGSQMNRQVEAEKAYKRWYSVQDSEGNTYFCSRETGEAMWEHPASVVLPSFYLKIRAVEYLLDEDYLAGLGVATDSPESPRPAAREGRLSRTLGRIFARSHSLTSSEGSLLSARLPRLSSKEVGSPCKVPTCISTNSCSTASFGDIDEAFDHGREDDEESELSEVPEVALLVDSWASEEP